MRFLSLVEDAHFVSAFLHQLSWLRQQPLSGVIPLKFHCLVAVAHLMIGRVTLTIFVAVMFCVGY